MQNDLVFVASKLLAKDAKDEFEVGTHHVEGVFTVAVKAVVSRLEDTEGKPTSQLLSKDNFAQFIARLGAIQDVVLKAFEDTWEAKLTGAEVRIDKDTQARIDTALAKFERMTDRLPKVPKKGSTTVKGTIQIVQSVKEAA